MADKSPPKAEKPQAGPPQAETKPQSEPEVQTPAESAPEAAPATEATAPVAEAQAAVAMAPADAAPTAAEPANTAAADAAPAPSAETDASVEELLKQGNFEDPVGAGQVLPAADAEPLNLPSFQQVMQDAQVSSIDLLRDVELNVKIELGRNRMLVEEVLRLAEGSVVELDKLAGDPVDVFVNDRLVARGEVLVLNDNFCVRVNEIVAGAKEEGL
jgi:flagellar motor switch protein FliN